MAQEQGPLVRVLNFHQTFERVPIRGDRLRDDVDERGFKIDEKGKRVLHNIEVDWVTYAPAHSPLSTSTTERVRHLRPPQELIDDSDKGEKAAFMMARWAAIEPAYEAWKAGHELPTDGTPLAHWPGVSAAMAEELKKYSIRTVEEVRDLGDGLLDKIRLPNMRELRLSARAFLQNVRSSESAEREVERDNTITALQEALKEQNERLEAAMALLDQKTAPPAAGDGDVEALRAELKAKGVKFHHAAGAATLKALLEESAS